jgi:hypothetical protein
MYMTYFTYTAHKSGAVIVRNRPAASVRHTLMSHHFQGAPVSRLCGGSKKTKTYNRRDSQMVTHSSTSRPVQCLCMAERTGCPVFTDLWSYVSGVLRR